MSTKNIGPVDLFVLDVVRLAKAETGLTPLVARFHEFRDERRSAGATDDQLQWAIATAERQLGAIEKAFRGNLDERLVLAQRWATAISALRVIMHGDNRTKW